MAKKQNSAPQFDSLEQENNYYSLLDFDLALLYEVENRTLKQSVRRNEYRFPKDFMFQLTALEWRELITNCDNLPESIKFSPRPPMAFTEQGVAMLSSILKSKKAVETNISIMRAFVEIRKVMTQQHYLSQQFQDLKQELEMKWFKLFLIGYKMVFFSYFTCFFTP